MNAVFYYSNTGQSKRVAEFFADKLNYPLTEICDVTNRIYQNAVLVFPVYCQNIPNAVKDFLKKVKTENLTVIATYGKMSCGNALYEIQRKYSHTIVAAAYVPSKHSYISNGDFNDCERLLPVIEKAQDPTPINLPKLRKNPLANCLKGLRSRLGVKIIKNGNCNGCGTCQKNCPLHAIKNGKPNAKCIRCLRCVENCPNKALTIRLTPPMKKYLKKNRMDELIIYV